MSAMERKIQYKHLRTDRIIQTLETLNGRLHRRFPESSLARLCEDLVVVGRLAQQRSDEIRNPLIGLRILSGLLVALIIVIPIISAKVVGVDMTDLAQNGGQSLDLADFVQLVEAGINDLVLIGAAIFFMVTLETRAKRRRALEAIHELRAIAHIIDMHQLTKDPVYVVREGKVTTSADERPMTPFELSRYLDYCSEMLALCGKIAALYIQEFNDAGAIAAVNEIEALTTGLSRKIWQKMTILESQMQREQLDQQEPAYADERATLDEELEQFRARNHAPNG